MSSETTETKDNSEYLPLDMFMPLYVQATEKKSLHKYTCENCKRQDYCELYRMEKELWKSRPHKHETHQTELFQRDLHQKSYKESLIDWSSRYYPIKEKQDRCLARKTYQHLHVEQCKGKLFEE